MNHTPRIAEVAKLERQRATRLAQERRKRGQWHWLSFVNKSGFLGGAIVWAHGMETAVLRARELKISGGFRGEVEVFCEPIPAREPHRDYRERLQQLGGNDPLLCPQCKSGKMLRITLLPARGLAHKCDSS